MKHGARRVRQLKWFSEGVEMLLAFDEGERLGLIRLLGAAGVKAEQKADLYQRILALGEDSLDYEVVEQLCPQDRP